MATYTGTDGARLRALLTKQAGLPTFGLHPDGRTPVDNPARRVVHQGTVRLTDEPADTITTDYREVRETLAAALNGRTRLTTQERTDVEAITVAERGSGEGANPTR